MPNLDPALRDCLTIAPGPDTEKYFLTAPVRWLDAGDDGEMSAIGVGSIDGKLRKEHVATLHSLATRVATHSERLALSRAATQQSTRPVSQAPTSNPATSIAGTSSRPTSLHPDVVHDTKSAQPMNGAVANGVLPEKIAMPPPPTDLERQKTEYMTPASDPSELKTMS